MSYDEDGEVDLDADLDLGDEIPEGMHEDFGLDEEDPDKDS